MDGKNDQTDGVVGRLAFEQSELSDSIVKLNEFLSEPFNKTIVGEYQWLLLEVQKDAMNVYLGVLKLRLRDLMG